MVQLFLRTDRLDLAQKGVKTMKAMDEDSILSMLAAAWVNTAMGGDKAQASQRIVTALTTAIVFIMHYLFIDLFIGWLID